MSRLAVTLLLAVSLSAQDRKLRFDMAGIVVSTSAVLDRLQVAACGINPSQPRLTVQVSTSGSFLFRGLPAGEYEFRVLTLQGETVASNLASVPAPSDLHIALPDPPPAPAGPVSVYRLSHRVPAQAQRLWRKAAQAAKSGDMGRSCQFLDDAIAADPGFAAALQVRGDFALRSGDILRARALLDRAAVLDPGDPRILADDAVANYAGASSTEAERLARSSLRLDADNPKAHYILALTLLHQGKRDAETLRSLRRAAQAFPAAAGMLNGLAGAQ